MWKRERELKGYIVRLVGLCRQDKVLSDYIFTLCSIVLYDEP